MHLRLGIRIAALGLITVMLAHLGSRWYGINPWRLGLEMVPGLVLVAGWWWKRAQPVPRVLDMMARLERDDRAERVLPKLIWIQYALTDLRSLDMDPRQQFEIARGIVDRLREVEEAEDVA